MPVAVESPLVPQVADTPVAKPLNQAIWQSWLARGRARDLRANAARIRGVKWVGIAGFLATSLIWSPLAPYGVIVRFVLSLCSLVLMDTALRVPRYAFGAIFGVLVIFYNPIFPIFNFFGDWQRALPLLSAVPFVMSLSWRERNMEQAAQRSQTSTVASNRRIS